MLLNEVFLDHLTPEEKKRYEELFVIRQEAKDYMKEFRKEYNVLKANVKKLEKKYGKSSEYIHMGDRNGAQDRTTNFVLSQILAIENKYRHIEHALYLSKLRQKQFTEMIHKFPFDTIKEKWSVSKRLSGLHSTIYSAKEKIQSASGDVRIANKYLGNITQHLQWEKDREDMEKKFRKLKKS